MAVYQDIDMWGAENTQGGPLEYIGSDAIKNALQNWITSKRGDFLRNPGAGGALDFMAFKAMSPERLSTMKFQLLNSITNNFYPSIKVTNINFIPDYTNRILEIEIYYKIEAENIYDVVTIFTNTDYSINNFTYEEVTYVEDNLLEFFTKKKSDLPDKRLLYDNDGNFWKWGKYKLVNLTVTDSRFADILEIANAS